MRDTDSVDVVVIGGGLAGIAAAAALVERGVPCLLLEGDDALGGKVRAVREGDEEIPRGPMVFEAKRTAIRALLDKLGLGDDVEALPAAPRYVVRGGALRPLVPSPTALLTSRALSWRARLDVLREPLRPSRPIDYVEDDADESVASFFLRRFGPEVTHNLLEAMVNGVFAGDPARLSVESCFPELVTYERQSGSVLKGAVRAMGAGGPRGTLRLRGGLWRIGRAAEELLPVRLNARVSRLEHTADAVRVVGLMGPPDAEHRFAVAARAAIVAVDAGAAAHVLEGVAPIAASIARHVEHAPLTIVHWREDAAGAARLPRGFGWLAPPCAEAFSLGTLFTTDLLGASHALDGRRRFAAFVGGVRAPERAALPDDALREGLARELASLTGGRLGDVVHVERVERAVAQPTLGHRRRMQALRAALDGTPIGVAGAWLAGAAMRDAVETGFLAAADAVRRLRAPAPTRIVTAPSSADVRIAVVGASYRDAPTELRARLAALEQAEDGPSKALLTGGHADGVVVVETCSRIEWIISAARPAWAADLLQGALASRVPDASAARLHKKHGPAALHYLLRVGLGLDSVAEGEPAVGRQVVRAFERGHHEGRADAALRQCWRALQGALAERRKKGIVRPGVGVHGLAVDAVEARVDKVAPILVWGLGEIGRATFAALKERGFRAVEGFRRDGRERFLTAAEGAAAVVVCTGAPSAYLDLPARDGALIVDVGSPLQTRSAPGWTILSLEDLLSHPRAQLSEADRAWLVAHVAVASAKLARDLASPPPKGALSAIDEERRAFLRETLPPVLEGLSPQAAEEIRRACAAFAHTLMERVREETTG